MLSLFVLAFVILLSLGWWQLSRANEKTQIIALAKEKYLIDPTLINTDEVSDWSTMLYTRTLIRGEWLNSYHYLQDNITKEGVAGYEILTPFKISNESVVLVNRGWIPKHRYHGTLSELSLPRIHDQTLHGVWVNPLKRFTLGDTPYPEGYPKIIQKVNSERIAKELNHPVLPLNFRLISLKSNQSYEKNAPRIHFDTTWEPVYGSPSKHHAYALQWFIFALILLFLFIKLNLTNNLAPPDNKKSL